MRHYASPRYRHKTAGRPKKLATAVLGALKRAHGQPLSAADLATIVYADREDGGPDWASQCIRVAIHWLRRHGCLIAPGYRLVSTEWEIPTMASQPDLNQPPPRLRGKLKATDFLPPLESVRIARTMDRLQQQRNAALDALAILEGQLAAAQAETQALREQCNRQGEELFKLRGPDPNVAQPTPPS